MEQVCARAYDAAAATQAGKVYFTKATAHGLDWPLVWYADVRT